MYVLLLVCAPLVSGFANMPKCGDNEEVLKMFLQIAVQEGDLPSGTAAMMTCPVLSNSCNEGIQVICAESCKYDGPCTGDEALKLMGMSASDGTSCGSISMMQGMTLDQMTTLGYMSSDEDYAMVSIMMPLFTAICGGEHGDLHMGVAGCPGNPSGYQQNSGGCCNGEYDGWCSDHYQDGYRCVNNACGNDDCCIPPGRRALKMTEAPHVDKLEASKLAETMKLKAVKFANKVRRLAQIA